MPILEITDLNVKYGQHLAVASVSLKVDHEIVCVLGANGAGKTSMLNAISGAVAPASGKISFNGADIAGRPAYAIARLGLVQVPQGRRIFAPLTVEDNLLIGAYTVRSKARQRELLEQAYALFPILKERRALAGGLLSGGQQQMLAFGRALMADPKMLLLDEPSLGLAPIMIQTVMAAVVTMAANGLPILMVEQNANMALRIAARAYVLEEGEIIVDGPATQIRNNPMVLRAFLGLEERTPAG